MWSGETEEGPLEDLWNSIMLQVRPITIQKLLFKYLFQREMEESEETLTCFYSKAQDVLPVEFLPLLNTLSSAGVSGGFHNTLLGSLSCPEILVQLCTLHLYK